MKAGCAEDMGRDVLKSDSAGLSIPEVGLEMEAGSLGGVYTTVEGLLKKVRGNLIDDNPFFAASVEAADGDDGGSADAGDSLEPGRASKMRDFVRRFDEPLGSLRPHSLAVTAARERALGPVPGALRAGKTLSHDGRSRCARPAREASVPVTHG